MACINKCTWFMILFNHILMKLHTPKLQSNTILLSGLRYERIVLTIEGLFPIRIGFFFILRKDEILHRILKNVIHAAGISYIVIHMYTILYICELNRLCVLVDFLGMKYKNYHTIIYRSS